MSPDELAALNSARVALRGVCLALPHLSGLAREVRLQPDARCETAGVFASGRLVFGPAWWLELKPAEAVFVMAHELLHLALDTHGRRGNEDPWIVNVAHDYIINDILEEELEMATPAGGLRQHRAREHSLEWWVHELKRDQARGWGLPASPFHSNRERAGLGGGLNTLGEALSQVLPPDPATGPLIPPQNRDVLSEELEREWFPGEAPSAAAQRQKIVRVAATQAASLGAARASMARVWSDWSDLARSIGTERELFAALDTAYQPPWEMALQRWFDGTGPSVRTYQRASRRGADRDDGVVLAGRYREGWTMHLVLDTSGSMHSELPRMLGVIRAFAEGNHVGEIHLIQADGSPPIDEWVEPRDLENMELRGLWDGDLTGPMERLAENGMVKAAVIVTDGNEPYPETAPPYEVLWALPWHWEFSPGYGTIMVIPQDL